MQTRAFPESTGSKHNRRDKQKAAERTNINIIRYVMDHPLAVRRDIAKDLALSFPNVCRLVSRFQNAGILISSEIKQTGKRGPRSKTLSLRPDIGCTIGVDLESTHIRSLILDFANEVVGILRRPVPSSATPEDIVSMVAKTAALLASSAAQQDLRVHAVGVALPGPVINSARGRIRTDLQPGLYEVEFGPAVESATGVAAFFAPNDRCFAHGHHRLHHSRATETEMVVVNRFGVSAAIVRNAEIHSGHVGLLPYGTQPMMAHYHDICTGASLLQWARSRGDERQFQEIVSASTDPMLKEWLSNAIPAFALAIYAGIVMQCPSRVIIEGMFNRMPVGVQDEIKSIVLQELDRAGIERPSISFFEGDDLMGAKGAAFMARDNIADNIISQLIDSNHPVST